MHGICPFRFLSVSNNIKFLSIVMGSSIYILDCQALIESRIWYFDAKNRPQTKDIIFICFLKWLPRKIVDL